MSDHISGPRAIADPVTDITDVFAFPCPESPQHLVLIMNVFPYAGPSACFSDAVIYRLRVRSASIAPDRRAFAVGADEFTFDCTFDVPTSPEGGGELVQQGRCTMPNGVTVSFRVNDENGGTEVRSVLPRRSDGRTNSRDETTRVQASRFRQTLRQECFGNCPKARVGNSA